MSWRRLLVSGLLAAALAGLAGGALERWWFGVDATAAASLVETLVRRQFDEMIASLVQVATATARDSSVPASLTSLAAGSDDARPLFDVLAAVRARQVRPDSLAITVYDDRGLALAWTGRPSDIPAERTSAAADDLFVLRSALGLRLVHVAPIAAPDGRRLGAVAAEHVLSRAAAGAAIALSDESLQTALAPVSFRLPSEGAGEQARVGAFVLYTPDNKILVEASVSPADLEAARTAWRHTVVAWVVVIAGITVLLLTGPLLDARGRTRDSRTYLGSTSAASGLLLVGAAAIWFGLYWSSEGQPGLALNLSFCSVTLAALSALWAGPATRLHLAWRARRRPLANAKAPFLIAHLVAGVAVAVCILSFALVLAVAVDPAAIDVRHFSLYPWNGARALRLVGILALQAAVLWLATSLLIAARGAWRLPQRSLPARLSLLTLWIAPTALVAIGAAATGRAIPAFALITSAAACGIAALIARRLVSWFRHATVAARIFALFLAFLVPAVLMYPSLDYFAERATRRLISLEYAVEAQNHWGDSEAQLTEARAEIDAIATLPELVSDPGDPTGPVGADQAFYVWQQTVLARNRQTSAVELYDAKGVPVSRFPFNLPEYTGTRQQPQALSNCAWEIFGEPLPIGSRERQVLHAERGVCAVDPSTGQRRVVGSVIVHVARDDYRTLPFITSQSPYFELFRSNQADTTSIAPGNDLRVAIYGWGLTPIYTSGVSAWPISEATFQRVYDVHRTPFWVTIPLGDATYNVYFTNDRRAIYAIGYPRLGLFDHLVRLAEVSTLAGAGFVVVLVLTALYTRVSRERPRMGRALLREIRASFYRKLFLAFVAAAIIPVLILALVIRAYFADLLRNDIQSEAARTASVAQRIIEESDALLRRDIAEGVDPVNDDVMVWIRQVIDQDVNIFYGPELVATSVRDLFQSGLLPTRTPDEVYRAIALQRLPSFVGQDRLGQVSYLIAATPMHVRDRQYILTVPLAARQQEIERQKYDLDRGVHLAALCFILLGAAIGLSLAERIADPVRRLTRATQRIAHGDFDARIAVRSADELRRLVDAFNSMAAELKAQRGELERTHRLEAWAEMARQVAHEIKNPLTPIQLSAEHIQRVHTDQGKPLGDVLDGCIATILGHVRLLRQIASEFSSFASAPQVKLAPVDLPPLIAEIVDPYRAGLAGRIEIVNAVDPPLPPVLVDRTLVLRALVNIVENALHAMPGQGRLIVEAAEEPDAVVVSMRDSGVGMDEEALARVFEPYFSTKTSGTGLGLPIARRNIELNGGTIEVASIKGEGTKVAVRLPRVPPA